MHGTVITTVVAATLDTLFDPPWHTMDSRLPQSPAGSKEALVYFDKLRSYWHWLSIWLSPAAIAWAASPGLELHEPSVRGLYRWMGLQLLCSVTFMYFRPFRQLCGVASLANSKELANAVWAFGAAGYF